MLSVHSIKLYLFRIGDCSSFGFSNKRLKAFEAL